MIGWIDVGLGETILLRMAESDIVLSIITKARTSVRSPDQRVWPRRTYSPDGRFIATKFGRANALRPSDPRRMQAARASTPCQVVSIQSRRQASYRRSNQ